MKTMKQVQAPSMPRLLPWVADQIFLAAALMKQMYSAADIAALVAGSGNPAGA